MGRRPMQPKEELVEEGKLKVTFVYEGKINATVYHKAIQVARSIGQTLDAHFNNCPVPVFTDSTVNSLNLSHKMLLEMAELYSKIAELEAQNKTEP